jgi:hypothetical protein
MVSREEKDFICILLQLDTECSLTGESCRGLSQFPLHLSHEDFLFLFFIIGLLKEFPLKLLRQNLNTFFHDFPGSVIILLLSFLLPTIFLKPKVARPQIYSCPNS